MLERVREAADLHAGFGQGFPLLGREQRRQLFDAPEDGVRALKQDLASCRSRGVPPAGERVMSAVHRAVHVRLGAVGYRRDELAVRRVFESPACRLRRRSPRTRPR